MSVARWLFDVSALTPHGFCLFWQPGLLWLSAISDTLTMAAYFSIPITLLWFARGRADLPHRWILGLFMAFIVSCGITHAMSVVTLWLPAYALDDMFKLLTALLSVVTAGVLWPTVPKLLALPSPARFALLNRDLATSLREQEELVDRLRASEAHQREARAALSLANASLERLVAERTAELARAVEVNAGNAARFRELFDAAPVAMLVVTQAGAVQMINTSAERMFGHARADIVGQKIEVLIPARLRVRHPKLRQDYTRTSVVRPMAASDKLFGLRRDGSEFPVQVALSPISTDSGPMILSAVIDLTSREEMENKLRQSEKMHAMGRVTAGVAHDFNNLLQALGGSLENLIDHVQDQPEALKWGEAALRAARRGADLTTRLLSYSRQQTLSARAVPVARLLEEVADLVRHMFGTRPNEHNEIVVQPGPPGLAAYVDGSQLEAALLNLAVNARDAMPDGGRLLLGARAADADPALVQPGRYVVVTVADTGQGMDKLTLERACDPFFTTKGLQGTGLGLSMAQGFARQSGGEITIVSAEGAGTTVEMWLPMAVTHPPRGAEHPGRPDRIQGRVLLVDDSVDVLTTLSSFLRHAGLDVVAAQDGETAVAALLRAAQQGPRFDLIVADYAMPGTNGLDLLARAREIDPSLPAMIVTGYMHPDLLADRPDVIVLRKPFDRDELVATVRRALAAATRPAAMAHPSPA